MNKYLFGLDILVAKDGAKEASFVGAEVIAENIADALKQHWDLIDSGHIKQVHIVMKEKAGDMFL